MKQNSTPRQIVSCTVCALNNAAGRHLIERHSPYQKSQERLRDILRRGKEGVSPEDIHELTMHETIEWDKQNTSFRDYIKQVMKHNTKYRYGPYDSSSINTSLEDKGLMKMRLNEIIDRIENIKAPDHIIGNMESVEKILRLIKSELPSWGYHTQFTYSVYSRKYPDSGYRHSVALRKVDGRWKMFDSEMKNPESPPSELIYDDISILIEKRLVPAEKTDGPLPIYRDDGVVDLSHM